jgi:hypothetical protein
VALPAAAILGLIGLCVCTETPVVHRWPPHFGNCNVVWPPPPVHAPFHQKITHHYLAKDNEDGEKEFVNLLCNGNYKAEWGNRIRLEHRNAQYGAHCLPQNCSDYAQASIKTDKVIVSEKAKKAADEELTSISPHVTQQIACQSQTDLDAVLKLLKQ